MEFRQDIKLSQVQKQKLTITQSLAISLKILQMTRVELEKAINEEILENPVLEELEQSHATIDDYLKKDYSEESGYLENFLRNISDSGGYFSFSWGEGGYEKKKEREIKSSGEFYDLSDYLLWQLRLKPNLSKSDFELCRRVVEFLDDRGFITVSYEELAKNLKVSLTRLEEILKIVRELDPPGVGASNLQESLLLQLELRGRKNSIAYSIIDKYWNLLENLEINKIQRLLSLRAKELENALEEIRTLDPMPGKRFDNRDPLYVEPDIIIMKVGDEYVVELSDEGLPRLRISDFYQRLIENGNDPRLDKWVKKKIKAAIWFLKSIEQRNKTIYKVVNCIVKKQKDFLDFGVDKIVPMTLSEVAAEIGVHESTVSRVVSNKYVQTPRGIFPLKFFFHSRVDGTFGEAVSSVKVKKMITELIENEDPKKPLTDSKIAQILYDKGIRVARRTVAKYRESLGIPSSTKRKRLE